MPYEPPPIPKTPSPYINHHLNKRFSRPSDNLGKSIIAQFVCAIFYSINLFSQTLVRSGYFSEQPHPQKYSKKHAWTVACAVVPSSLIISTYIFYLLIITLSHYLDTFIIYFLAFIAFFIVCVGVCAVFMYDDEASKNNEKAE